MSKSIRRIWTSVLGWLSSWRHHKAPCPPEAARDVDVPTVGELVQVARYFRAAMEQRRSIGLRAFFASTGFDLLIVKSVLDYPQLRSPYALGLVRTGVAVGLVLYLCLIINIERENWYGRESYRTVEESLRQRLGSPEPRHGFQAASSGWQAMRRSWSGLWPGLAASGVAVACFMFLSTL